MTALGTLLHGRYRLDAQIGTGGMSTVYRAFDTVLERDVAIKLMHRDMAGHPEQLERFRREARAVAQLSHPHIVTVIDAGEEGGEEHPTPYIVFEYVAGETLKDRVRRVGRLPVGEAVAYAIEIARALDAAHQSGIVHRDVKPQNVLVDEEGTAKVTDFGIARTLDQEGLTADGRVLGTTDYVSPEQALGHDVGPQSDLYSLGVVLFEMLTGQVPFRGPNQVAVAMKHVREELPDVRVLRPEASAALAAVVERSTAKDLGRRHATAEDLACDLEDVLSIETARSGQATGEATTVLRSLGPSARRRVPLRLRLSPVLAVVALAAVAATVAVVVLVGRDKADRGVAAPAPIETPRELQQVALRQNAARDFDPPPGDGEEHREDTRFAIDDDRESAWDTESYDAFTKPGVGLYVDARPGVAAKRLDLSTGTPGWRGAVYAARGSTAPSTLDGWTKVGDLGRVGRTAKATLDTGTTRFRFYLVWITDLPEGERRAEIRSLVLYR